MPQQLKKGNKNIE